MKDRHVIRGSVCRCYKNMHGAHLAHYLLSLFLPILPHYLPCSHVWTCRLQLTLQRHSRRPLACLHYFFAFRHMEPTPASFLHLIPCRLPCRWRALLAFAISVLAPLFRMLWHSLLCYVLFMPVNDLSIPLLVALITSASTRTDVALILCVDAPQQLTSARAARRTIPPLPPL